MHCIRIAYLILGDVLASVKLHFLYIVGFSHLFLLVACALPRTLGIPFSNKKLLEKANISKQKVQAFEWATNARTTRYGYCADDASLESSIVCTMGLMGASYKPDKSLIGLINEGKLRLFSVQTWFSGCLLLFWCWSTLRK